MTFRRKLEEAAALIEKRLALHLAGAGGPERLAGAMRHAVLGGGKRLRPYLLIESAQLFGVGAQSALDAACALECLHCYSLVHDDLPAMDDDTVRRGVPTVHRAFDVATAILAGDALLTLAFEIVARPETHGEAAVRSELALHLARAAGARGMAGGQALDLEAEGQSLDAEAVERLQGMKTGALIAYACEAGAIVGGASGPERSALIGFGRTLGRAFQLADDLLDAEGDPELIGKATAKDAAAGKATLVSALGIEAARKLLFELERAAISELVPFGERAETLREAARFVTRRGY